MHGRGIYLMKSLMDKVRFERGGTRSVHAKEVRQGTPPWADVVVMNKKLFHVYQLLN
jgi:hypothetical protein